MADSFSTGGLSGQIADTPHGPEISISGPGMMGTTELARLTVGECEILAPAVTELARTARAKLSAQHKLNNLPMQ